MTNSTQVGPVIFSALLVRRIFVQVGPVILPLPCSACGHKYPQVGLDIGYDLVNCSLILIESIELR